MLLWEVASCPTRPSDLMGMADEGYSHRDRLEFDLGIVGYARKFERKMQETKEAIAPKPDKQRKIRVPLHEKDEYLRWLGVDPETAAAKGEELEPEVEAMVDDLLSGKADWLHNPGG